MADVPISGFCPPRFDAVRTAFEANFAEGLELGARFALAVEGRIVIDLIGGWADRAQTRPFAEDTLTAVFSTTKAIAAFMIARLVDQVKLSYGQRVADIWPAFGEASKSLVTVEQVMAHQAGLPGFAERMEPSDWFDWELICGRLAAMTPMWRPGDVSGYHPVTFGYLAGRNLPPHRRSHHGAGAARGHRRAAGPRSLDRRARRGAAPLRRCAPAPGAAEPRRNQ